MTSALVAGLLALLAPGPLQGAALARPQAEPEEREEEPALRAPAKPAGPLLANLTEFGWSLGYSEGGRSLLHRSLGQGRGAIGPITGAEGALRLRHAIAIEEDAHFTVGGFAFLLEYGDKGFSSTNNACPSGPATDRFTLEGEDWGLFVTAGAMTSVSTRVVFLLAEAGVGGFSSYVKLRYQPTCPGVAGQLAVEKTWVPAVQFALTFGINIPGPRLRGALPRLAERDGEAPARNTQAHTIFGFRFSIAYTAAPSYDVDWKGGGAAIRHDPTFFTVSVAMAIVR
ncbi:MAG: hypothetical protein L0216_05685 [Planctomycetales bacterium]|nr:hypothetical protein [Planctomycetales bacterium]